MDQEKKAEAATVSSALRLFLNRILCSDKLITRNITSISSRISSSSSSLCNSNNKVQRHEPHDAEQMT